MLDEVPLAGKYSHHLRYIYSKMRARLYAVFLVIPVEFYSNMYEKLLPKIVEDVTAIDDKGLVTSLMRSLCPSEEGSLLDTWADNSDQGNYDVTTPATMTSLTPLL